jgi:predicted nucleotidyltransferase component of viral defense system
MIPLILKIKKTDHKEIAVSQDLIIKEVYKIFDKAVLHGGTCIWRCYQGNRFSEDIDVYIKKDIKKIDLLFENLKKLGFIIKKKKITENTLFSNLQFNRVLVRLEAVFKEINGSLKEYETSDSNLIMIYALTPEELIKEKIQAYLKRLKIRDLYDIFFLLKYVKNKQEIKRELTHLIKEFKMPIDEKELRVLIIEGIIPDAKKILEYLKLNA